MASCSDPCEARLGEESEDCGGPEVSLGVRVTVRSSLTLNAHRGPRMKIFAAERAVGVTEVLCWDTRDGGVGGEGQGLLVRVAAFWCPCPHCSLGCPSKVGYSTGSSCALRGILLGIPQGSRGGP